MTEPSLFAMMTGLVALLVAISALGYALRETLSAGRDNQVIENLNARITAWWAMLVLLAFALIFGRGGVIVLFGLISFAALREFLTLTEKTRADHWALLAAFFVVLPMQYYWLWTDWYAMYSVFIPVYAFLLLPVISALRGDTQGFLVRVAETQWALMICVFCASHVPALLLLDIPGFDGREVLLIAFLVFVVQMSDVLQYLSGRIFGGRAVAEEVSASRTWAGCAGGVAGGTAVGALMWWMTPFTLAEAAGLSLAITLMGTAGGLVMAAIKKDRGVRDWGQMFAWQGGFVDRLDGVVFAAPIFFHLVRYFYSAS